MDYTFYMILFALSLFLGMLLFMEVGRRIGIRLVARDPDASKTNLGAMETAVWHDWDYSWHSLFQVQPLGLTRGEI
jgi:hypothetical protein